MVNYRALALNQTPISNVDDVSYERAIIILL